MSNNLVQREHAAKSAAIARLRERESTEDRRLAQYQPQIILDAISRSLPWRKA